MQRIICSSDSFFLEKLYPKTFAIKINHFSREKAIKIKHLCNGSIHPPRIGSPLVSRSFSIVNSLLRCSSKIPFPEVRVKSHKFSLFVIAAANDSTSYMCFHNCPKNVQVVHRETSLVVAILNKMMRISFELSKVLYVFLVTVIYYL